MCRYVLVLMVVALRYAAFGQVGLNFSFDESNTTVNGDVGATAGPNPIYANFNFGQSCSGNEVWSACGSQCDPTCLNPTPCSSSVSLACNNTESGTCVCTSGTVRVGTDCVSAASCANVG